MDYEVSDIKTKILKKEKNEILFSIKATVRNLTDDEEVFVELQGIDDEGFEIFPLTLTGHIKPGEERTLTSSYIIDQYFFEQIVDWQVK